MQYNDSQDAFNKAIETGKLSANPNDYNYAGNYMYMGSSCPLEGQAQEDFFKDINTREYI